MLGQDETYIGAVKITENIEIRYFIGKTPLI